MLQKEPAKIWKWIEDKIISSPEKERSSVITTPYRMSENGNRKPSVKENPFVAMARTLGIPARLNPHDRSMEYMKTENSSQYLRNGEKGIDPSEGKCGYTVEIFPELEHRKTGSRKIYHTELEAGKFQRSGDEAADGSGEITGSLPQTDCQMEIYLQRSIILRFRSEK